MSVDPAIVRSCFGKRRYGAEAEAIEVATTCQLRRDVLLRTYACEACGGWHLTKSNVDPPKAGWRPAELSQRARAWFRKQNRRRRGAR